MFTKEQFEEVSAELRKIKENFYEVSEVSDLMKKMVVAFFGDEDWSTSGYWIRAEELLKEFNKAKVDTFFNTHSGGGIFRQGTGKIFR